MIAVADVAAAAPAPADARVRAPATGAAPDRLAAAVADARAAARGARWVERPVVTVGFFDGLHLGHRRILADLAAWAAEVEGGSVAVTFDRHPGQVLGRGPAATISSLDYRLILLARAGVEAALVLPFDRDLASWSAEEFVRRVIRGALESRRLLMGFDSAFGRGRAGTFEYLRARDADLGIEVRRAGTFLSGGVRVSSTLVRETIAAGDLDRLAGLLGRPYSVLSEVVPGDHRGRELGFPTANLVLPAQALPPAGVYFARAAPLGPLARKGLFVDVPAAVPRLLPAVVNVGRRPTFQSPAGGLLVEAHLLDFEGDLYGRLLEVQFFHLHREERKFPGAAELIEQIRKDIAARRSFAEPATVATEVRAAP